MSIVPNINIKDIAPTGSTFGSTGVTIKTDVGVSTDFLVGYKVTDWFAVEARSAGSKMTSRGSRLE